MNNYKRLNNAFLIMLIIIIPFTVNAQKLPNKQSNSLYAPSNVKVDGKADEWGNKFEAFNNATDIFYTIANDDKNLYLIVEATDPDIINNKILPDGLTLAIQIPGKNDMSITYPVKDDHTNLHFPLKPRQGEVPNTTVKTADSIMNIHNKILDQRVKYIAVKGIEGLDNISVYNGDGIKAAGLFDNKKAYIIELSVELKVLGLSASDAKNFKYHISLNGSKQNGVMTAISSSGANAQQAVAQANFDLSSAFAPTDFWGEYALAKK